MARSGRVRFQRPERRWHLWLRTGPHIGAVLTVIGGPAITVADRAVSQVNLFWHHKFESASESWLWFGIPQKDRLNGGGSLDDWIIGANVQTPISDCLALYGNAQYMHPSAVRRRHGRHSKAIGTLASASRGTSAVTPGPASSTAPSGCRTCRWPTTAPSWLTRTNVLPGERNEAGACPLCYTALGAAVSNCRPAAFYEGRGARDTGLKRELYFPRPPSLASHPSPPAPRPAPRSCCRCENLPDRARRT